MYLSFEISERIPIYGKKINPTFSISFLDLNIIFG